MDKDRSKLLINQVWIINLGGLRKRKSLLYRTVQSTHGRFCKKSCKTGKTDLAVISGGLTSILQPVNVSIYKPFKDTVQHFWNQWMLIGDKTFTKGGNMRALSLVAVCAWVRDTWQQLDLAIIVKAFLKYGISNALDGTKNYF